MSKVNGQSVAAQEKSLWAGPTPACGLWLAACGSWCVLAGGTHPIFLFLLVSFNDVSVGYRFINSLLLEGWRNTTSPLAIPAQEFFTLADVGLR